MSEEEKNPVDRSSLLDDDGRMVFTPEAIGKRKFLVALVVFCHIGLIAWFGHNYS
jgi:hypothetical protein